MFKNIIYSAILSLPFLFNGCAGADAGDDIIVKSGDKVTLSAQESVTKSGGKISKYTWEQNINDTIKVTFSKNPSKITTFIAPSVKNTTVLHFTLRTVEDYNCKYSKSKDGKVCQKDISIDRITVTVNNDQATETNNTDSGTLTGIVIDIHTKKAISDVNVSIDENTATTDENGSYSIKYPLDERSLAVTVTHKEYFSNTRLIESQDINKTFEIYMAKPLNTATFESTEGLKFIQNASKTLGSAIVNLPIDAYVKSTTTYNGKIHAKMSYYDASTTTGKKLLPGIENGQENSIIDAIDSLGFIQIALTDEKGNTIELSSGQVATLTFPAKLGSTDSKDYQTIPLSSYDTNLNKWVKSTQDALLTGENYVGEVSKLDIWSLDLNAAK